MQLAVQHKVLDVEQAQLFYLCGGHEVVVPVVKPFTWANKHRRHRRAVDEGVGGSSLVWRESWHNDKGASCGCVAWSEAGDTVQIHH